MSGIKAKNALNLGGGNKSFVYDLAEWYFNSGKSELKLPATEGLRDVEENVLKRNYDNTFS